VNNKSGEKYSAKFLDLFKRAEKVLDSTPDDGTKTNREAAVEQYADWKEETENTELPNVFTNVKYDNLQAFMESLQSQSGLSNSWMSQNVDRFVKWLAES